MYTLHTVRQTDQAGTLQQAQKLSSARELYRPSDRRLSVKLVPTFTDRGVSRSQRAASLTAVFSAIWTGAATISLKQLLNCTHEAEWTPFQTHYFSENLEAPELWPLDHRPTSRHCKIAAADSVAQDTMSRVECPLIWTIWIAASPALSPEHAKRCRFKDIVPLAGFEVFTAVTMKNAVFWDVAPCGFIISWRFGWTCRFHLRARRNTGSEEKCWTVANRLTTVRRALNDDLGRERWAVLVAV
jgi:hypothetical protein